MKEFEYIHYAVIFFSAVFSLIVIFKKGGVGLYRAFCAALLVLEGLYIGGRWVESGHPPIFGTFEETLAASFAGILFSLAIDRRGVYRRFTIPFSFVTLLYGLMFDPAVKPLVISEKSLWVYFHVLFAWFAYGLCALNFSAAVYVLSSKGGADFDGIADRLMDRGLVFIVFTQTVFFALGSYYSSLLHGSWWVWDPVEYLFIVSWFTYAIAMHGRIFFGWKRRLIAKWIVGAFLLTIVLYWGLIYIPWASYHIFDAEIKVHMTAD